MELIIILIIIIAIISNHFDKKKKQFDITQYSSFFTELQETIKKLDGKTYILHSKKERIKKKLKQTYTILQEAIKNKDAPSSLQKPLKRYLEIDQLIQQNNKIYLKNKMEKYSKLFNNIEGKSLDRQQRFAIVQEENNHLVIAGAGTGKTLTIIGKIKYLTEVKKIQPEQILLISYSRKTVRELDERINKKMETDIQASTFHKLGKGIIEKQKRKKVDVAEDKFAQKTIKDFFRKIIVEKPKIVQDFILFYSLYINAPKDENLYATISDFYDNTQNYDYETIKSKSGYLEHKIDSLKKDKITINREFVKSIEEVSIANFLFLNGVEYKYEALYPYDDKANYRKQYRPDFYLPEYDIWLEHFGLNKDGSTAPSINEYEYKESIKWKRNLHRKNETTLLETYSWQNREGILLKKLEEMLRQNKVKLEPVNTKDLYKKLFLEKSKDRQLENLQSLFATFLNLYKSLNKSSGDIDTLKAITTREKLFVHIFKEIYEYYESKLKEEGLIDFNDMINEATEIVKTSKITFPYKYILIDEYQDISFSRFSLIKAIRDKTKSKLMCVGDDWQSIYRFAGSDLDLFSNFKDYFGFTVETHIVNTHRNSQELIDLAGHFIMKNPRQIKKTLLSDKHTTNPIQIITYKTGFSRDEIYSTDDYQGQALLYSIRHIIEQGDKSNLNEILLLGRTHYDLEDILGNFKSPDGNFSFREQRGLEIIKCSQYPNVKLRFLTVHKAKGLQAENVIILNMRNHLLGFPNQIIDDPILSLVLTEKDTYDFAEERRLFYVALTRTKNRTYLITPENNYSIFIKDIMDKKDVEIKKIGIEDKEDYGKCECGGNLIVKLGRNGPFLSCEHYPLHNFTKPCTTIPKEYLCPKCGKQLVRREGSYGSFIGCSGYPNCKYTRNTNTHKRKR